MPPFRKNKNNKSKNKKNERIVKRLKRDTGQDFNKMSVTALKKKIRDIERVLKTNEKLSAEGQVSLERKLKASKLRLVERVVENKEKNMIAKYRMVKHFDRKKVERAIKKVQKQSNEAQTPREKTELEKNLYELQIDFNYILYYPKSQKYLALHPTNGGNDEEMISKRNEIRQLIKEAMQNNDLESLNNRFREGIKSKVIKKMTNDGNRKKENKQQERYREGSNSDEKFVDDFFGSEEDDKVLH